MATKKTAETTVETTKAAAAEKKTPAKKTTAPKKTAQVVIEFAGNQYIAKEIVAKCEADYKANNKDAVKTIEVYVKPEEGVAYYVVNGNANGDKVEL